MGRRLTRARADEPLGGEFWVEFDAATLVGSTGLCSVCPVSSLSNLFLPSLILHFIRIPYTINLIKASPIKHAIQVLNLIKVLGAILIIYHEWALQKLKASHLETI